MTDEVTALRATIERLEQDNARLRDEVARLRDELYRLGRYVAPPPPPAAGAAGGAAIEWGYRRGDLDDDLGDD
jgi:hypothetical protein